MVKRLIDIDDDVLERVMRLSSAPTMKAAVDRALRESLRRLELDGYLALLADGATDDLNDPEIVASAQR